jgi:serine protease Do
MAAAARSLLPSIAMRATRLGLIAVALLGAVSSRASDGTSSPRAGGETAVRSIARRVNPAVVSVMIRSRAPSLSHSEEDLFRALGLAPPARRERVRRAAASGFVISAAGEILTNSHVIDGCGRIDVELFGDERTHYRAVCVGRDPLSDTALIRLQNPPTDLQPVVFGDSGALEPGDWIMAIGNPFELGHTVTVGVVSFTARPIEVEDGRWQDMIQTDAAINPGSSGGPLVNARGEVVGMAAATLDGEGSAGVAFAIPINTVKALLPRLRIGNIVRGQLGIQLLGGPILDDEAKELGLAEPIGAIVMLVDGESAAARGGLRAGDVIVAIDGHPIADTRALLGLVASLAPGTSVAVRFVRDRTVQTRTVTLEAMPIDAAGDAPGTTAGDDGGVTLDDIDRSTSADAFVPADVDGAVVVSVVIGSPADDAELAAGDIIRAVNSRRVHTRADAMREWRAAGSGPLFLLVWREGMEVFLRMRRD